MTDKNLDKILKTLGDFDPRAKPNWEAFVAGNEAQLENTDKTIDQLAGKAVKSFAGIKYAAIILTVVSGIFFTWYFSGTGSGVPTEKNTIPEASQSPAALPLNTFDKASTEEAIPSLTDKSGVGKELINESIVIDGGNMDGNIEQVQNISGNTALPVIEETPSISPDKNENQVVIKITDTVFVKKTIYITDTVKVEKAPIKN